MKTVLASLLLVLASAPNLAGASGTHGGGHSLAIGETAKDTPSRTVEIIMLEPEEGDDFYIFEPRELKFAAGESVRLHIINKGDQEHEFVMDTPNKIAEHKEMMRKFPEMEHDDPNAVRLQPGEEGEILWTFGEAGTYEFACLLIGHYDGGMHGPLIVN